MELMKQIAKHLREVHFGGNWTASCLREQLKEVTWQQATTKQFEFNTIAALVFHINYYVGAVLKVLQGGPLEAHDRFSFDVPPITSEAGWQQLIEKNWNDAENVAVLIEQLPDEKLEDNLAGEKYGNYFRNLHGIIEHSHYHLGQIVILKKLFRENQ